MIPDHIQKMHEIIYSIERNGKELQDFARYLSEVGLQEMGLRISTWGIELENTSLKLNHLVTNKTNRDLEMTCQNFGEVFNAIARRCREGEKIDV